MFRPGRKLLFATLIAVHAAVSCGGAGLHALPGWGHGSGLTPAPRNDHSHGPGKSSHDLAEECPVCQALAERQAVVADAAPAVAWAVFGPALLPVPPEAFAPALRRASPRAPPLPAFPA